MNNLKKWSDEHEKKLDEKSADRIKQRIDGSMDLYRFLIDVVDLYVPKVFGYMSAFMSEDQKDPHQDTTPTSQDHPNPK